jgi:hypothetical protein
LSLPPAPITVVVVAAVAADADAAATMPSPLPPRHYFCSLCQRHCVSNAPVNGWLLCRLLPLAYCVICRPNLSAPAIVRSLTLLLPGRRPLLLSIFYQASIFFFN